MRDNVCHRCTAEYRVDLNIPDDLWARLPNCAEKLCGQCIVSLLERLARKEDAYGYLNVTEAGLA